MQNVATAIVDINGMNYDRSKGNQTEMCNWIPIGAIKLFPVV